MVFTLRDLNVRGPIKATRPSTVSNPGVPMWRWGSLGAVIVALAYERIHHRAGEPGVIDAIAGSRLAPVDAVLASWAMILLGLLTYAVFQLAESQRRASVYDRASRPLALACGLAIAQLVALQAGAGIGVVAGLAGASAGIALLAYRRVQAEIEAGRASPWVGAPFSVLLGYTGCVAIAALDVALLRAGVTSTVPAIALLVAAGAAAVHLGLSRRDALLPAFAAWSLTSIGAARPPAIIATSSLLAGALCGAVAIVIAATQLTARFGSHAGPDGAGRRQSHAP